MTRNTIAAFIVVLCFLLVEARASRSNAALAKRIDQIIETPEYRHAIFGIEFYSLDSQELLYALNANALFMPASTTKVVTEGTALNLLGPDYRFHTKVYRTGAVLPDGTLDGDLVLVASGDPNLSARVQNDGTLAFENTDHSLSGEADTRAVPGDPLLVIRELAKQVAARGIKQIQGHVLIDCSLFAEGPREHGTEGVVSPIIVNDNLIDIVISPGATEGVAANLQLSPTTSYLKIVNRVTTSKSSTESAIDEESDVANADGSRTVTLTGQFPLGRPQVLYTYPVPVPSRFAEVVFVKALSEEGVEAKVSPPGDKPDFKKLAATYTQENQVAEHVSPAFREEVKVTLKVSQNLHAATTPFLLGALLGHPEGQADQAGFDLERQFLEQAGLDLGGAAQSAGEGSPAFFSPDFMVHYLSYMATTKYYHIFLHCLPVLGRDGTLWNVVPSSPAAGHVFAKTGTTGMEDKLNRKLVVTSKGLVGYETTAAGEHLAFAIYVNNLSIPQGSVEASVKRVNDILGQIATAAYETH